MKMIRLSWLKFLMTSSLKNKLISFMVLFTIIPFGIFSVYTYINTQSKITKDFIYNGQGSLNKCTDLINRELLKYSQRSDYICSNDTIMAKIEKDFGSNLVEKVIYFNDVNKIIDNMQLLNDSGKDIFTLYISNKSLYENKYFKFIQNAVNKDFINKVVMKASISQEVWSPDVVTESSGEKYIYLYRNLLEYTPNKACLEVKIPFSDIAFYMKNTDIPKGSLILYRDANGQMSDSEVSRSNNKEVQPKNVNIKNYTLMESPLINSHNLVVAVSNKEIRKRVLNSFGLILIVFFLAVLCMVMASIITSKRCTVTLDRFINTIKDDNNLLQNLNMIEVTGNDEVSLIKRRFKELVRTIDSLYAENMEAFKKSNQLEMDLLQSKINPHLLYNSLSVIKWSAQRKLDHNTVKMVDCLTRYYRKVLNRGNNILKIRDELDLIVEYVNIMSYSHANDYRLEMNIDENILDYFSIKLIFQPLVENAILHGLNGKEGEKKITITGTKQNEVVLFSVEDNGYGMDEETIRKVLSLNYKNSFGGGYGMKNLISRIDTFYGEKGKIEIESEIGKYTKVQLTLPVMDEKELTSRIMN